MANQLTHALLAGAVMALLNPLMGMEPVSWNIFLAGIIGMAMNLDSGQDRISGGSPAGHSLGAGMVITYLAGIIAYFGYAFAGWDLFTGMMAVLAIGTGAFTHLAAEYLTGHQIFTFPRNLEIRTWLREYDDGSERFWNGWGRFCPRGMGLKDFHLNGMSLVVLLLSIWMF